MMEIPPDRLLHRYIKSDDSLNFAKLFQDFFEI